ncbi:MAG: SDR family NAD(P)-dependent oxidoreductase [Candidatus Neomarinimicrobiota bacterium]|nr:MAG: SDR family NAD(P)-dependent oxidoreductase [Candidatus Neomarinimicrobiota bacterium]
MCIGVRDSGRHPEPKNDCTTRKQGGRNVKKTIIITGASRGIGRVLSLYLAPKGYDLIGIARNREGLEETGNLVREKEGTFVALPWDLSAEDSLEKLGEKIRDLTSTVYGLVHNAGVEYYQHFENNEPEDVMRILRTNLLAPIELTRILWPELERSGGAVVSIASLAGKKGVAYNSLYSASKGGLILWSEALRQEKRSSGVRVSVICPGYIRDTGMFHNGRMPPPRLLGTSPPEKVAEAVWQALEGPGMEMIVNSGPIRPLLALNQLWPALGDRIVRWFGVVDLSRKRIPSAQ